MPAPSRSPRNARLSIKRASEKLPATLSCEDCGRTAENAGGRVAIILERPDELILLTYCPIAPNSSSLTRFSPIVSPSPPRKAGRNAPSAMPEGGRGDAGERLAVPRRFRTLAVISLSATFMALNNGRA